MGGTVFFGTILGMVGVGPVMAPSSPNCGPLVVDKWAGTVEAKSPPSNKTGSVNCTVMKEN